MIPAIITTHVPNSCNILLMSSHATVLCPGDNMNRYLNENWKEVVTELGPHFGEAISQVIQAILTNIFELVPYDEAFPEEV